MDYFTFAFAVSFCTLTSATAQTENTDTLESCSMVCNCNSGQYTETDSPNRQLTNQGPPGKLGPKGVIGSVGAKGEKGDTGLKGQKGMNGTEISLSDVLGALSASSCQDLHTRFRVSRTGYYLMKNDVMALPGYKYCDFRKYTDVTTCDQLFEKHNISSVGYYLFGQNSRHSTFQICPTPPQGIYTCQAFRDRYPVLTSANSGRYEFQSLSAGTTYSVYCDFSQSPSAFTEIHHNMMGEMKISSTCGPKGCFSATPQYEVSGTDINRIIDNSVFCRQFIKLRCRGVLLRHGDNAWWVSKGGQKMTYWGGATKSNYCACGETNSCINTRHKCNCDQNSDDITTSDEGYLTDKTKLPLRDIRVGDVDDAGETAWYTIGKLECFGQV